jgi:DNA-directed RNA polymerase subunit K/omega
MSDNEEEYHSDNESTSEISAKIKTNFKKKPTITDYNDDDDDVDDDITIEDADDDPDNDDKIITVNDEDDDDDEIEVGDEDEEEIDVEDDDDIYDDDDDEPEEDEEENDNKLSGGAKTSKNKVKPVNKPTNIPIEIENNNSIYDYDDDEDEDDNYLQKFDKEITKNYIVNFHPECLNHNYDEIKALSKVTRDEFNIIIDPLHKTVPFLTKYEKARILGQRAKQIECGAKPLVKVPENIIDSYVIAELELEQKAIPFIIRRPIPSGGSEYWNLKDLEMISF